MKEKVNFIVTTVKNQLYYCLLSPSCTLILLCSPKGEAYSRRFVRLSPRPSSTLSGK